MVDLAARHKVRELALAAVERVEASGQSLEPFRGVALHDTEKDRVFTSLDEFEPARAAVASLSLVQERYGSAEATRLVLQFVYELLARLVEPVFDEQVFDALWNDFSDELEEPQWVFRGVANVQWVHGRQRSV